MTTLVIKGPLTRGEVAGLLQQVRDIERRHSEGEFVVLADLSDETMEDVLMVVNQLSPPLSHLKVLPRDY